MSKDITYTVFKGTDYEFTGTKKEIAKQFCINYSTLISRINRSNFSLEEAINYESISSKILTVFKDTDKEFTGNLKEISQHFNINVNTLYRKYRNGLSLEKAIDNKRILKITVFKGTDREFTGTKIEISEHFNIKYTTLLNRVHEMNLSLEEAIDWKDPNIITVFKGTNKEFSGTKKEIAEHFNIKPSILTYRIRNGMTPEEAINYKSTKNITIFQNTEQEFNGNMKEIAIKFNLKYLAFKQRLLRGYSPEEAIEIPAKKVYQNNLIYKNTKGNMKELCKNFNKDYIEVYNKVKNNHTFEWAMDSTLNSYEEEL